MQIRRPLTLRQMEVLCALAETGSVSRTAARLRVSQPAVSYQLRQTESLFDAALFERRDGRMQPSAVCERLLEAYRGALESIDRAHHDVESLLAERGRTLRISTVCATTYHWLPDVLDSFRRAHPGVEIVIHSDPDRAPVEAVERGDLDVALTTQRPRRRGLTVTRLFRDEIVALVSAGHPLARRRSLSPRDLEEQTTLTFDHRRSDAVNTFLAPAGVRPRRSLDVGATEALVTMVRAGLGVGFAARWVVQPDILAGNVVPLRLGSSGLVRTWFAVTAKRKRHQPAFIHGFVQSLLGYAEQREPRRGTPGAR